MNEHFHTEDGDVLCDQCADFEGCLDSNETDCPENCCDCGRLCEYGLTADGVQYVVDRVIDELEDQANWRRTTDYMHLPYYQGSASYAVVFDWVEDMQCYGGLSRADEFILDHFREQVAEFEKANPLPPEVK